MFQELPEHEKEVYQEMARQDKANKRYRPARNDRMDCTGEYISVSFFIANTAIFNWVLLNQNQSYHSDQSQRTHNLMNQSNLKVITYSWREAWENVCEGVMIGFGFTLFT